MANRLFILAAGLVFLLFLSGCAGVFCDQKYVPVCGADGKTYNNACFAGDAGTTAAYTGRCLLCNDSDDGKDITRKGTVRTGGKSYEDSCRGAMVAEQYCEDPYNSTIVKEAVLNCPADSACIGGSCALVKCTDSDGGENAAAKGTAVKSGESKTDACQNNVVLTEYYCFDNGILSKNVSCPEGSECSDGACRTVCVSSSGGAAGTYDIYKKSSVLAGTTNGTDYCVDSAKAMKYYCGAAGVESKPVACPSGYVCFDGRCTRGGDCQDSDGGFDIYSASDVIEGGTHYYDECANQTDVREFYCDGGVKAFTIITCPSGYACAAGACIRAPICFDSDYGKNIYDYGYAEIQNRNGAKMYDECKDTNVLEYYCDADSSIKVAEMPCPPDYNCIGGKCVGQGVCRDSDGGQDVFTAGTTEVDGSEAHDYCLNEYSVREFYCSRDDTVEPITLACPSGYKCYNGACTWSP